MKKFRLLGDYILKLNVGCSTDLWGDVRLDITSLYLKSKSSANIYADAQNMPFMDKAFEETKAWNILEHLPNWRCAIKEWCRVTSEKIQILVLIDAGFKKQELIAELFSLNFLYIVKLPNRRREHLWQFNSQSIIRELEKKWFRSKSFF